MQFYLLQKEQIHSLKISKIERYASEIHVGFEYLELKNQGIITLPTYWEDLLPLPNDEPEKFCCN